MSGHTPSEANDRARLRESTVNATQTILALREELKRERVIKAELLKALKGLDLEMPAKDALCHYGIYEQSLCMHCGRIVQALAAIAVAEGRKP